jgi:hypothetical protein
MFSVNLTRPLRALLALALLAVWHGSLLHPLQHVDAKGAFVHVPGKQVPKVPGDKSATNLLCDAIAAVVACVAGPAQLAVAAVAGVETVLPRKTVALFGAPPPAYRSQAPPAFL